MIDPKELRIGNFITYKSVANTNEIFEVSVGDLFRIEEDFDGGRDAYDPIQITPEWLERFGFTPYEIYGDGEIRYDFGDIIPYSSYNTETFEIDNADLYSPISIRFVHQLQNLYFALTGNELER